MDAAAVTRLMMLTHLHSPNEVAATSAYHSKSLSLSLSLSACVLAVVDVVQNKRL